MSADRQRRAQPDFTFDVQEESVELLKGMGSIWPPRQGLAVFLHRFIPCSP